MHHLFGSLDLAAEVFDQLPYGRKAVMLHPGSGQAEQAPGLLDDMVARAERAIVGLELPYRIIEICTGDMGQSHHRSFDVEVWAPGAESWLEVSSVSWFSDYQARRGNVRFRPVDDDGKPVKGTEFVHTLNGSALAVPRVWAAIVENYRNPDGAVTVPEALRPYMRGIDVIAPGDQPHAPARLQEFPRAIGADAGACTGDGDGDSCKITHVALPVRCHSRV